LVATIGVLSHVTHGSSEGWYDPLTTGSGSATNLATNDAAVRSLIAGRKTGLNMLHMAHDGYKMQLDHHNLLMYERRNLQYAGNAMINTDAYYRELKYRNIVRNERLYAENQAYNASVQFNEELIKHINQTYHHITQDSAALDAHNIELMAEIGAVRNGNVDNTDRTFGLTRQRQNSVQRKLLNHANFLAVDALAIAMRAQKKHYIEHVTRLRGEKNDAQINNQGLEMYAVTLVAQRNLETTEKLLETDQMKNMKLRRDDYATQVPALENSRKQLEAKLKNLVIENARARELYGELLERRLDLKKDLILQKWNYVEALLQRNKAVKYKDKMKSRFNAELPLRDASMLEMHNTLKDHINNHVDLTKCEADNRHVERHKSILTHRNALLTHNCWHVNRL